MKIRTDFVTNSSSSSFSVMVSIEGKNGKEYSFSADGYEYYPDTGGHFSFINDLKDLSVTYGEVREQGDFILGFPDIYEEDEEEEEVKEAKDRLDRLKNVKVGSTVSFEKRPGVAEYFGTVFDFMIDVKNEEGSLGLLPVEENSWIYYCIGFLLDQKEVGIKARVSEVHSTSEYEYENYICIVVDIDKTEEERLLFSDVSDIAKFLMDSIHNECYDDELRYSKNDKNREFNEHEEEIHQEVEQSKKDFIREVTENIPTKNDISKIIIQRSYEAWGENTYSAEVDEELYKLARKVNDTTGEEQKKASKELLAYIHCTEGKGKTAMCDYSFSVDRYVWEGKEEDIPDLARGICNGRYWIESGRRVEELNLEKGTHESFSEFDLK